MKVRERGGSVGYLLCGPHECSLALLPAALVTTHSGWQLGSPLRLIQLEFFPPPVLLPVEPAGLQRSLFGSD